MRNNLVNKLFLYNAERSYPTPLSAEEEAKIIEEMKNGDASAREKLITHNMRLVVHLSKKYYSPNEWADLISAGFVGLIKGVDSYDPDKKIKLSSYLGVCIKNEIKMYLRRIKRHANCESLEKTIRTIKIDDQELTLEQTLESNDDTLNNSLDTMLLNSELKKLLTCLSPIQQQIISLRYGLEDGDRLTQQEVSEITKLSRSSISKIEKSALEILRQELPYSEVANSRNKNKYLEQ